MARQFAGLGERRFSVTAGSVLGGVVSPIAVLGETSTPRRCHRGVPATKQLSVSTTSPHCSGLRGLRRLLRKPPMPKESRGQNPRQGCGGNVGLSSYNWTEHLSKPLTKEIAFAFTLGIFISTTLYHL